MVTSDSSPYSPSEKRPIIEEGDLPELERELIKSLNNNNKTLGKTDAQIAHSPTSTTRAHGRSESWM